MNDNRVISCNAWSCHRYARIRKRRFFYARDQEGQPMIALGIILLVVGYLLPIPLLYTLGVILLVVGALLYVLGAVGRPVAGRRHWY